MKKWIAICLVLCLILCGCSGNAQETPETKPSQDTAGTTVPTTESAPPEPEVPKEETFGLYQPDSEVELATGGAVKQYQLESWDYQSLILAGDKLLLLSGENDCVLTCISPDGTTASVTLKETYLMRDDIKYIPESDELLYYNINEQSVVRMDMSLKVVEKYSLPETMKGLPEIGEEGQLVYYMTDSALRYLDLETGIDRMLKEMTFSYQSIHGLYFDGAIIECLVRDEFMLQSMMISTETGELLFATDDSPALSTEGDRYFATVWESDVPQYLFGDRQGQMQCLTPPTSVYTGMVELWAAMTCEPNETGFVLSCYDLETGTCYSSVDAPVGSVLYSVTPDHARNSVWFFGRGAGEKFLLYRWELEKSLTGDDTSYVSPYYTPENPDAEGLLRIGERAREIGRKYGIRVWVAQEALQMQPSDYTFEAQHLVSVYDQYLTVLDEALGRYPDGFLKKLSSNCANGKLTISLIKGAYGDNGLGSLESADGVHFFNDGSEYIGLVMGGVFESTLYHELFHSIDTYVMSRSNLYDFWNDLNPEGFRYDNDYVANQFREDFQYLNGDRWFIDMYSMSYAKEDRARIMEYAMGEGNSFYFQSPHMQAKLAKLSEGIRTAFNLKGSHGTFPWEQYLK